MEMTIKQLAKLNKWPAYKNMHIRRVMAKASALKFWNIATTKYGTGIASNRIASCR